MQILYRETNVLKNEEEMLNNIIEGSSINYVTDLGEGVKDCVTTILRP